MTLNSFLCVNFQSGASAAVASGECGDLSSDLEPPTRSRKKVVKAKSSVLNLANWSDDDSDFDPPPVVKTKKGKGKNRRSLLPSPGKATDSADLSDCTRQLSEYVTGLRSGNQGSLFPKLASDASTSSLPGADIASAATSADTDTIDASCIIVSDDDMAAAIAEDGESAMDTAAGGARPKVPSKHSREHWAPSSNSESDSLLSPPKKHKAKHTPKRRVIKPRSQFRFPDSPEPEGSRDALFPPLNTSPMTVDDSSEEYETPAEEVPVRAIAAAIERNLATQATPSEGPCRRKLRALRGRSNDKIKPKSKPVKTSETSCDTTNEEPSTSMAITEAVVNADSRLSSDSVLANMITDMAVHDEESSRPPRIHAPLPRPCTPRGNTDTPETSQPTNSLFSPPVVADNSQNRTASRAMDMLDSPSAFNRFVAQAQHRQAREDREAYQSSSSSQSQAAAITRVTEDYNREFGRMFSPFRNSERNSGSGIDNSLESQAQARENREDREANQMLFPSHSGTASRARAAEARSSEARNSFSAFSRESSRERLSRAEESYQAARVAGGRDGLRAWMAAQEAARMRTPRPPARTRGQSAAARRQALDALGTTSDDDVEFVAATEGSGRPTGQSISPSFDDSDFEWTDPEVGYYLRTRMGTPAREALIESDEAMARRLQVRNTSSVPMQRGLAL